MKAPDYVNHLATQGQHCFTTHEIMHELGLSQTNAWAAIIRLEKKGLIASPHRGFHVIVPPESRRLGCLPPEQFIPDLMAHLNIPYYIGLLSAAQYYGASHQQAQIFQVVTPNNRNKIHCGQIRIEFIARENMFDLPTQTFNTPKGYLNVSTPEVTALDLANYPLHSGGLNNVLTTLEELVERIKSKELIKLAGILPSTPQWQRLGFLFEAAQQEKLACVIENILKKRSFRVVQIVSKIKSVASEIPPHNRWKIIQNETLESDL